MSTRRSAAAAAAAAAATPENDSKKKKGVKKKAKTKAPRELMGKRVAVDRQGKSVRGQVVFHGPTQFHEGNWVGVALDKAEGMNDG